MNNPVRANMNSIRETVWPLLYPLKMPDRKRDRPMQVLALGLSRSGTDSLRNALCDLGYAEVYHAFYMQESQGNDGIFWTPLIRQKLRGEAVPTDAAFWDRVLGQCQGVTDFPCCLFYKELMQAYPHAHIIVNVRALDPWHASIVGACMPIFWSWPLYVLHFFDAELFWMTPSFYLFIRDWFEGSLQKNGKRVAQAHYAGLEAYCKEQGREYLTWDVTEGWYVAPTLAETAG